MKEEKENLIPVIFSIQNLNLGLTLQNPLIHKVDDDYYYNNPEKRYGVLR